MFIVDDACGRYVLNVKAKDLAKHYNLAKVPKDLRPNYNVAPGQIMPIITAGEKGLQLEMMRWGLWPVWNKDPRMPFRLINARDDKLFESNIWKQVIFRKRALIPASSFYEWQKPPEGSKEPKQVFNIHPKQNSMFSFAGVWEAHKDVEGKEWKTYSIITTEPNKQMAKVHNRMPVILHQEDEASWLEPSKVSREDIEPFLHPFEDNGLNMYKVSGEVNKTSNNYKELLVPLAS